MQTWEIPIIHATQIRAPFEFRFHLRFTVPTLVFGQPNGVLVGDNLFNHVNELGLQKTQR